MSPYLLSALALLPIGVVALFLVALRWPASRAMPLCYLTVTGLALGVWGTPPIQVAAATINGIIIAATMIFIVFGAIVMLNTLRESGALRAALRAGCLHFAPAAVALPRFVPARIFLGQYVLIQPGGKSGPRLAGTVPRHVSQRSSMRNAG